MPPPPIGSTATPHLDMPEHWSSNADALDAQLKALDAVEAEYRSIRRLLVGAAGILLLTIAVVAFDLGILIAIDHGSDALARLFLAAAAVVVTASSVWFGVRLSLRAFRDGRATMNAVAYWYRLPITLTEAGGPIPLEHLSHTNAFGALSPPEQPKAVGRGILMALLLALTFPLLLLSIAMFFATDDRAAGSVLGVTFLAVTGLLAFTGYCMLRSWRRARKTRAALVFLPDELIDEVHELPESYREIATAVQHASKVAGIAPPPIRIGRAKGDFMGMAYEMGDGPQIVVQDSLTSAPLSVQEFVAAHELAHIELQHAQLPRGEQRRMGLLSGASVVMLLSWWVLSGVFSIPGWLVGVGSLLVIVASRVVIAGIFAPNQRERETAADRRAVEYGYPLTAEMTDWLKHNDPSERSRSRFRTHPTWDERHVAVREPRHH